MGISLVFVFIGVFVVALPGTDGRKFLWAFLVVVHSKVDGVIGIDRWPRTVAPLEGVRGTMVVWGSQDCYVSMCL